MSEEVEEFKENQIIPVNFDIEFINRRIYKVFYDKEELTEEWNLWSNSFKLIK